MIIIFTLLCLCSSFACRADEQIDTIMIAPSQVNIKPMKIFVGVLGDAKSEDCQQLLADFKYCCDWSGRFDVDLSSLKKVPKKKSAVRKLFDEGYDCALFITYYGGQAGNPLLEWRLYDTAQGQMVQGKKIFTPSLGAAALKISARHLATQVLQELTTEPQPFFSKIVYRKKQGTLRSRAMGSSLIVTDFDGKHAQSLVQSPTRILVSPRWNNDAENPVVVFSEFTQWGCA